ncbi:MAG: Asp-tRNA(Asn)/Glu-tRNA(Gln) amidotransferase subunit GatA [Minisyncoccota bacterium]
MIDLSTLNIVSAREGLKSGKFSSHDLTQACLNVIKEKNEELNAFLEVFEDALIQADEADKKISEGIDLPLLGIPVALKDNMLVAGQRVTAGSKILEGFIAPTDCTAVKKLREAGAVIVGRTNMDEFAMGASTEGSAFGPTKNPVDLTRVPGGSSGGSAAALASGMILAAYGSDTGGSVRQPAAFCGVVGFKPTYGRVSRSGLIAMASSLDQISPFAKTVTDAEILYKAVSGSDPMDSTTISDETYPKNKEFNKTIGVPRAFFEGEGVSEVVKKNLEESIEKFKSLGYKVMDISLPNIAYSLATYYILMPAEVSSNLARFDGVKYGLHVDGKDGVDDYFKTRAVGFGREVRRRIILGTYVLSSGYYDAYYGSAIKAKQIITDELRRAFKDVDLILTPTAPTPAFKFGEKSTPLDMYLADIFTVPANISGCPAISIPFGEENGLPLGVELMADLGREDNIFRASKEFLGE